MLNSYIKNILCILTEKPAILEPRQREAVPEASGAKEASLDREDDKQAAGPPPKPNREEKSDGYSKIVVQLNRNWRVIECKDGIQWILQSSKGFYKDKPAWRGRSYCRTKKGLLKCINGKVGLIEEKNLYTLNRLPEFI